MIILTGVDEVHKCLEGHWGGSFRKEMMSVPGELKVAANSGAPCIAMSATLTPTEIDEVKKLLKLRKNLVIIKQNPILDQTRIVNITRPNQFENVLSEDGNLVTPGKGTLFYSFNLNTPNWPSFKKFLLSNNLVFLRVRKNMGN